LAIGESVSDRVVIVSLNDRSPCFTQDLANSIGEWTESAEISKTVKVFDPACCRVFQQSFESEIIAVDTTEKCDPLGVEGCGCRRR
jgi:hypothetical protein